MSNAYVYFNDDPTPRLMSDGAIMDYVHRHPGTTYRCECKKCRQPIKINNKDASLTRFRVSEIEVVHDRRQPDRSPYSHTEPRNNDIPCPDYKPNDPRWANRDSSGEAAKKRREDNLKTVNEMRNTLNDIEEGMYFKMTGLVGIPPEVKEALTQMEKSDSLMGTPGLAERKNTHWLVFKKFAKLPPQLCEFPDGARMVVFKPEGEVQQKVSRRYSRRKWEMAKIPAVLVLHYVEPDAPVIIGGEQVRCRTTEESAYQLAMGARERRKNPPKPAVKTAMQDAVVQAMSRRRETPHSLVTKAQQPKKAKTRKVKSAGIVQPSLL